MRTFKSASRQIQQHTPSVRSPLADSSLASANKSRNTDNSIHIMHSFNDLAISSSEQGMQQQQADQKQPLASLPIQRVEEAKKSLVQPDPADKSASVPDLTQTLVDELSKAKATESLRQGALDNLLNYLISKNVIEQPPPGTGTITTKIVYNSGSGGNDLAVTQYSSQGKTGNATITITVYAPLFTSNSVAAIYSTIRHELIHAAQRTQQPNDVKVGAEETDEYMFENDKKSAYGKQSFPTIQAPLQEIETHVWEIKHAAETGINNDPGYLAETWKFLKNYASDLTTNIKTVPPKVAEYWSGYVKRAIKQLRSLGDANADKWANDLDTALSVQLAFASLPKSGSKSGLSVSMKTSTP